MVFPLGGTGILMDVFFRSRRRNWNTERSPQNFPGTVSFASSSSHIPFLGSSENRRLKSTELVGDMWSLGEDIQYTNLRRLHREIWGFYTVVSLWYCSCGWLRWWIGLTRLSMPPFSLTSLCKYYRKRAKHEKCEKKTATSLKLSKPVAKHEFYTGFPDSCMSIFCLLFKYLLVSFYFLQGGGGAEKWYVHKFKPIQAIQAWRTVQRDVINKYYQGARNLPSHWGSQWNHWCHQCQVGRLLLGVAGLCFFFFFFGGWNWTKIQWTYESRCAKKTHTVISVFFLVVLSTRQNLLSTDA